MFPVKSEDLVRALKRFKSLAKQDLLTSEFTSDPVFWQTHAEARRNEYTRLIDLIENFGVEKACVYAFKAFQEHQLGADGEQTGEQRGSAQAIELFFQIIGLSPADLKRIGEEREKASALSSPLGLEFELSQEQV